MARSRPHDIQGTVRGLGQVANWLPGLTNIGDAETIHSALNWLRHAGFEKDIKNAHFPKDPRKLNGEAHRPVGVLDEEVLRAAARCGASQSELGRFALLRQRVDGHLLHGDWEAALRVLAGIEDELGQSLWLIRTSVATLTQMPGSAVGSYCSGLLAAVRNRGRVALVAGYTRPLGQRSLNPFDHAERIILRMAERNVPAGVRSYLGWVVTGQLHTEASVQADLLAHTSRGAVIDTFEALVAVIHSRFRCRQDSGAELYHAATALCRVDDPRLLPPLAMQKGVLQHATSSPYDAIARGAPAAAPGAATDYWSQIDLPARSWACQGSDAGAEEASWSPSRVLRRGLLAALNGEPEAESFTQAYRVALLFGSSVWARDYVCAIEEESLALGLVDRPPVHALCTLGSKPVAVVPPPYLRLHPSPMCATAAGSPAAACSAVAAGTASDDVLRAHADVSGEERALALALGALRREEWTAAFADSTALVQSSKRFYRRRGLQIRAQALVRSGDYGAAARTMCDYLVEQKGVWFDLPVQDVLSAMTGRAHGAAVHARDRAILYSLPPAAAYSELRDEQMNAFDDLLDEYGVDRPSNLPAGVRAEPWCGYFLAHTCSADMIERSLRLPTKRAALEERIKICQLLEASGPEDVAAATRLEAISLTRLLSVTSQAGGLEQVKLTLDVERLKERVRSAVALDYARYVEGVRRGERPMHSDTILGMLEAHTPVAWDKLDLRSDPVWEVFSTLARKANQTYVADPTYGLNAILSMRIRHGAVEGLIHGEFRDFGLLTTRKGDRYCANEEWTGRWASACGLAPDSPLLARFADALSSLTKALDGLVRDLCDSLLRVRGEAHPRGLIEARLSEEFLRGLAPRASERARPQPRSSACSARSASAGGSSRSARRRSPSRTALTTSAARSWSWTTRRSP